MVVSQTVLPGSLPEEIFFHLSQENLRPGLQFLEFEGARLAFDFQPSLSFPCQKLVVLLNGYQRSFLDYRVFRKKIQVRCPHTATLALDNRYSGQTVVTDDEHKPLTVSRMARDAFALSTVFSGLLKLSCYSLAGISMGGMIAQVVAAGNPFVEKLFLVSTTAGGQGRTWPDLSTQRILRQNLHASGGQNGVEQTLADVRQQMQTYFARRFLKNAPLLFDIFCQNVWREKQGRSLQGTLGEQQQRGASDNFDATQLLATIRAQTILFSGDEDGVVPLENSLFLKQNLPDSVLHVYSETGHLLLIEEPEKFVHDFSAHLCGNKDSA